MSDVIVLSKGKLSNVGLSIPDQTTYDQWEDIGKKLKQVEQGLMWWLGDWLNFGERKYGEKHSQALEATEYNYQTIADAAWVACLHIINTANRSFPLGDLAFAAGSHRGYEGMGFFLQMQSSVAKASFCGIRLVSANGTRTLIVRN